MVEKDIYKQIINKLNNKEDWIKFDSMLEAEYFKKLLLLKKAGEIIDIELQPKFELQPAFEKNGKKYRAINYYADFKVTYKDGHVEIIDIKGNVTKEFAIKRKMFEYRYKDLTLKVINKKGEEI
ncbi:MAG: DUF1064 domain-containing protein [Thermosipho sp. (in: Bacteria)]|nr:DUF1064 domain-containing protein [Thermosipho sp. (in: thermotogales)]